MKREKYKTRQITLTGEPLREILINVIRHLPILEDPPLEVVIRDQVKQRKLDQQGLMWAGPLKDISEQVYVNGRTYSDKVWHEEFKARFLPEQYDEELTKDGYRKWDVKPNGERVLVGSTTDLTIKGMAQYITQIHAFGAEMGVLFHANPNEARTT